MEYNRQRREMGLVLGLILGVGYALPANLANHVLLPDVPLYAASGVYGAVLLNILLFGLLGLIATWSEEALPNIVASSLAGALLSWIWYVIEDRSNIISLLALVIVMVGPLMFVFLPFAALVRWYIDKIDPPTASLGQPTLKPGSAVGGFVLFFILGLSNIHPTETRLALVRMQALLETGMQAEATSFRDLPRSLQPVEGFAQKAEGNYSFIVGRDPDELPVQRPIVKYGEPEPFIIVRFENGFQFGCVFSPPYETPACIDF